MKAEKVRPSPFLRIYGEKMCNLESGKIWRLILKEMIEVQINK